MHEFHQRICWLREQFPWMGKHSGYDLVCEYIQTQATQKHLSIQRPTNNIQAILAKILVPLSASLKLSETYGHSSLLTEIKAATRLLFQPCDIIHILYVERMLGLLAKGPRYTRGSRLVGTVHQPKKLWQQGRHNTDMIRSLDALIVLSTEEKEYFERYLPGRVHFIPHGIDIHFFHPLTQAERKQRKRPPRCVFSGVWMRDIKSLAAIIEEVLLHDSKIQFDLLVPESRRSNNHFDKISALPQVHWHSGLNDIKLRSLYQNATLMLLPMESCTANNALLEGTACGLPVISNHIGGIPDYTDQKFARLFQKGDIDGMVEAVLEITGDEKQRFKLGNAARQFVETNLSWEKIALKTVKVYSNVLK